jgi:hypothetical protein
MPAWKMNRGSAAGTCLRQAALNSAGTQMSKRRLLLQGLSAGGAALLSGLGGGLARSAEPLLAESDPKAVELAYVSDAGRADRARFPKFAATQRCSSCSVYQGGAGSEDGGCVLFPGKRVTAAGWCSAWTDDA